MPQTVEVRFKGTRREFFAWPDDQEPLRLRDAVVVEVERGQDLGRVHSSGDVAQRKCGGCASGCGIGDKAGPTGGPDQADEADATGGAEASAKPVPSLRAVVRRASQDDIRVANELRRSEEDTRRQVLEKVRQHRLDMKVSDTEWQWDRNKLTVYFTAEKRVDFRALVRDLASYFRTRIDLRQIGVRDEAARLSGVGRCGREYCCSSWLTDLSPVSLSLAKDQHLSLNPAQISGGCGRLLCCLKYEHEFYVAARKRFPREGKNLATARGTERVVAVDIFRERVFLRHDEQGPRIVALVELQQEMAEAALAGPLPAERPPERTPRPERRVRPLVRPAPETTQAGPAAPESDEAAEPQQRHRRRRRRRRGRNGPPPGAPPSSEG